VLQHLASLVSTQALGLSEVLTPLLFTSLLSAVSSISSASEKAGTLSAAWVLIDSSNAPQATRFALAQSMLASSSEDLVSNGSLDHIVLEAAEEALRSGSQSASDVASACVGRDGTFEDGFELTDRRHFK
jgi:hypothetical protein